MFCFQNDPSARHVQFYPRGILSAMNERWCTVTVIEESDRRHSLDHRLSEAQ